MSPRDVLAELRTAQVEAPPALRARVRLIAVQAPPARASRYGGRGCWCRPFSLQPQLPRS
jgi:hypothetical protein